MRYIITQLTIVHFFQLVEHQPSLLLQRRISVLVGMKLTAEVFVRISNFLATGLQRRGMSDVTTSTLVVSHLFGHVQVGIIVVLVAGAFMTQAIVRHGR